MKRAWSIMQSVGMLMVAIVVSVAVLVAVGMLVFGVAVVIASRL